MITSSRPLKQWLREEIEGPRDRRPKRYRSGVGMCARMIPPLTLIMAAYLIQELCERIFAYCRGVDILVDVPVIYRSVDLPVSSGFRMNRNFSLRISHDPVFGEEPTPLLIENMVHPLWMTPNVDPITWRRWGGCPMKSRQAAIISWPTMSQTFCKRVIPLVPYSCCYDYISCFVIDYYPLR